MGSLVTFLLLGCSSDSSPGSLLAVDAIFPDSPLAAMQNVSLLRAGENFTLAGYENGQVRWGHVTQTGVLTLEAGFPLRR
jgi:hypothetical protein